MSNAAQKGIVDLLARLRTNRVAFVESVLRVKPQQWQREALEALDRSDRLAVKSGHGVGKTALLAWLVLHQLLTTYPTKVVCTANTSHQLEQVLWAEIQKWAQRLPKGLSDQLAFKSDRIELKDSPSSFAVARTSRKENPESLQGFHEDNMLFIIDEASGVPDTVFEVGRGSLSTEGAKVVMTGNPTRAQGYFYNAFTKNREIWNCMTVNAEDAEYVSQRSIDEWKTEYGEDSNVYRVRVKGEFPTEDDDALIPIHLVEAALRRDIVPSPNTPAVWGLDVARYGADRSALAKRKGGVLLEPIKWWRNRDLMQLSLLVKAEYDACNALTRPGMIMVDVIGIGAGVHDRLRELGIPVRAVNVSETPSVSGKYARLRDELWFKVREWLESRECALPEDDALIKELVGPKFRFTESGKLKVEGKEEMKRRLGEMSSPDLADALCLTFAGMASSAMHGSRYSWNKPLEYPSARWVV